MNTTLTQSELQALRDVSPRMVPEIRIIDGKRVRVPVPIQDLYWKEDGDGYILDRQGVWWSICRDRGEMVKQRSTLAMHMPNLGHAYDERS